MYTTTIHKLLETQARAHPNKIALVEGDIQLTYRELNDQANRLANYLRRYDIGRNDAVGILLEKCYEYVVVCAGILKAGGAYLHLELAYPNQFLGDIFVDAAPKVVITKRRHQQKVLDHDIAVLCIDDDVWLSAENTTTHPNTTSDDIAIIGYSSGTTGQPKGICVSHRATLYAYHHFWRELRDIGEKGRFAYTAFLTWDALSPLVMGETGYMIPDEISYDPHRLLDFIAQHKINHTFLTPSLLSTILQTVDSATIQEKLACLNVAWVGGEVTTQPLVDKTLQLLPHLTLINNYGPAECFVITQGKLQANDPETPTICSVGEVLDGMEVLLLDEMMQPVPEGTVGELYATGPCLADGYLNNLDLTNRKFIPINKKIYYKTGDSARFLADGRLTILGRRDETVKIRSYNVNMLAIEETLRQHAEINDCIVQVYGAEGEDKYLVAYLLRDSAVSTGSSQAETSWQINPKTHHCPQLASYLQEYLPFYMVPQRYVELDAMPLHPISGKLDRSRLPKPHIKRSESQLKPLAPHATLAEQEQLMVALLQELLGHEAIEPTDDFFALGLHSLLAAQMVSRIRHLFDHDLAVAAIFTHSTARQLVAFANDGAAQTGIGNWQLEVQLDDGIVRQAQTVAFSAETKSLFLTGATGYLGAFLLADLLCHAPTCTVYCLLRSAERLPALIQKLKFYQLWQPNFAERIVPLVGDLALPRFGWSETTFEQNATAMEAVFHVGAWVNMAYPYHQLKAANVGGTHEAIRFAACGVTKPLHYVSTLGIFPAGNPSQYREDDQIDTLIEQLTIGYTQSKWVAEKLVWQAIERGLPAQIYRIGNIGPDSTTRLANSSDTMMLLLDTCKKIRLAPYRPDWLFEYTPVNIVSGSMVQMALVQSLTSPVFHIAGDPLIPALQVFELLKEQGEIEEIVQMETWLHHLRELVQQQPNSNYDLLEHSLQIEEQFLCEQEPFDMTQFNQWVARPIIDAAYIAQAIFPASYPTNPQRANALNNVPSYRLVQIKNDGEKSHVTDQRPQRMGSY